MIFRATCLLIAAVALFAIGRFNRTVSAQAPSAPQQAPLPTPATALATSAEDATKRNLILNSERWKKVEQEFHNWLDVQVVYTPQQIQKIKGQLTAETQRMTAPELEQFLDQWDAKLKVLLGPNAGEAREWLGQYLSVIADGRRKEFLANLGITDVTQLTAAQIEAEISKIRAKRLALQQQRAVFDAGRQQSLQTAQQFRDQENAARQQAGASQAASFGTNQSAFAPRQYDRPPPPVIPFFW